jgi:rhodanese-related sulfurtransferase
MGIDMKDAIREGIFISITGILLGFGYTAVTGKGLFGETSPQPAAIDANPPEYFGYEETYETFSNGNGIIVDSRSEYDYGLGHIRGSVNLPLKEFDARKSQISSWPKDTLIITYCDGQECNSSMDLATKLAEAGFTNVKFFFGGWTEWQQHQSPEEGGEE